VKDKAMTIGERLEEARKRKGVSVREAAEATKVRGDFLLAMENNSFDINLPEIYTRGFLKIYANFLKLDVDKIVTDYEAMRMGGRKATPRTQTLAQPNASMNPPKRESAPVAAPAAAPAGGQRASFGRMELGDAPQGAPDPVDPVRQAGEAGSAEIPRGPLLKLGAAVGGLIVLIALITLIVSSIGGEKPVLNPEVARNPDAVGVEAEAAAGAPVQLIATDAVTVWVTQKSDGTRVFEGTLALANAARCRPSARSRSATTTARP
jgi:transcriptional regulator with XRE-family HTH domain